jgi:hypothetical protein
METIQARVNPRLLSKADRLFTGTLDGRIIEILQNARRAGATRVDITNKEGLVTVSDNGRGIADFSALLDLGKSDWQEGIETAEDPAGVGIFCLAPRELCICSGRKTVVITEEAWTGKPVQVQTTRTATKGTRLTFRDDPWTIEVVSKHAVFVGLKVTVGGKECDRQPFVSDQAIFDPELGCRIEVCEREALSQWHMNWKRTFYQDEVLVNFHGQVVQFSYAPVSEHLQFLVDLTGEPTAIRLMLPARTQVVENKALEQLKAALETEAYKYIQRRGVHKLKYAECRRARELGIELPEAEPVFTVGLLTDNPIEPAEVFKPGGFPLSRCYRLSETCRTQDDQNEANVHLLSALGTFDEPFVVVDIPSEYDGYSWAKLPCIDSVEVTVGKEVARDYMCSGVLVVVETLQITAIASDGRRFTSAVPMAIREAAIKEEDPRRYVDVDVMVTPNAREHLCSSVIWYHLDGWSEDGDTFDTQLARFEEDLDMFWSTLVGPGEYLRTRLLDCLRDFNLDWKTIALDSGGTLSITRKDGTKDVFPHDQAKAAP